MSATSEPDGGGSDPSEPARAPDLGSVREVRELLARYGLAPDKGLGQNFLVDRRALAAVADTAELPPSAHVLEVGPGLGALTAALAVRARHVLALELDARLLPALRETTEVHANVEVRRSDAMAFDHEEMPEGSFLVSNLPYQIATALLAAALESCRYRRMAILVQREVAQRITAAPGEAGFGAFSLLCAHFALARIVRDVAPGCFLPPPKVVSSIVRLDVREEARPDPRLFALVHEGFRHRRKTLVGNLRSAGHDRDEVVRVLAELGLDPRVRAEVLPLATWRRLRDRLAHAP